ncbi:MAG TPA: electron transfer flavoprotein subunit alpha/FixB family protein, partial [Acidobacteriota bacterium]|nr:electron transfer flavoprotein subunit alpha/FixB family protein [Acidobacteriota bacterium]
MSDLVLVLAEHGGGKVRPLTWECLAFAQDLASRLNKQVVTVVLGKEIDAVCSEISAGEQKAVWKVSAPEFEPYNPDYFCAALSQIAKQSQPYAFVFSHTYRTIDFAPRLAARLDTGLIPDVTRYHTNNGKPVFLKSAFHDKLTAEVSFCGEPPYVISLQIGSFPADSVKKGAGVSVETQSVDLSEVPQRRRMLQIIQAMKNQVDLSKAEIIVAVGRGIGKPENMKVVQDLAAALGAEIGASRPIVDMEWLPRDRQIGSSGQTVAPKVYLAIGISGAIQHIVGMKNAAYVVAINKDPNAPIFKVANYGIVGDLFEVVP